MRHVRLLMFAVAASCSQPAPPPAARPTPPPAKPVPAPADVEPAGDPSKLITTACVLHAGGGNRSGTNGVTTKADCWYNAECVAKPGEAGPGDGFVSVECDQKRCKCEWAMAHENHPGGDAMRLSSSFSIETFCVGDVGKNLLVDRCMGKYGLRLYRSDAP